MDVLYAQSSQRTTHLPKRKGVSQRLTPFKTGGYLLSHNKCSNHRTYGLTSLFGPASPAERNRTINPCRKAAGRRRKGRGSSLTKALFDSCPWDAKRPERIYHSIAEAPELKTREHSRVNGKRQKNNPRRIGGGCCNRRLPTLPQQVQYHRRNWV